MLILKKNVKNSLSINKPSSIVIIQQYQIQSLSTAQYVTRFQISMDNPIGM